MQITLTVNAKTNTNAEQFAVALRHRPDWSLSFTSTKLSSGVRVTYSDRLSFGLSLDEAMAYCDRHQVDYTPVEDTTNYQAIRGEHYV